MKTITAVIMTSNRRWDEKIITSAEGKGNSMVRKTEMPVIELVEFYYAGSDKEFNKFLKAVVREYVINDKLLPDRNAEENETA